MCKIRRKTKVNKIDSFKKYRFGFIETIWTREIHLEIYKKRQRLFCDRMECMTYTNSNCRQTQNLLNNKFNQLNLDLYELQTIQMDTIETNGQQCLRFKRFSQNI